MQQDVIIVGAGLAGLSCARELERRGISYRILEAEERIGGRVQTDHMNGFLLDHGFQVLQTGYPEAEAALDFAALHLQPFPAGVAVRHKQKFQIIADPRHHPRHLLSTISAPIGTITDRLAMLRLARKVCNVSLAQLLAQPEQQAGTFLAEFGFSEKFISTFFLPFFAGACLDRSMTASSRTLKYLFRVFATGDAALPANGMAEIPLQLAQGLQSDKLITQQRVTDIANGLVRTENGKEFQARKVIIATSLPVAEKLCKLPTSSSSVAEACVYFSSDWKPPCSEPFLVLAGDSNGPVNNLAFPSMVAPAYAPAGKTLVAAIVLGQEELTSSELEDNVRVQCARWFGEQVHHWQHLKTYHIQHALPAQQPPTANPLELPAAVDSYTRICGEYQSLPGIQWALLSGRQTGQAVAEELTGM